MPDENALVRLYQPNTPETDRWVLAVKLRNGGTAARSITEKVSGKLVAGSVTMESAFILSGLGEPGFASLGKALRQTANKKAARDAAISLSQAGAVALVSLPDLVASLPKDWRNTRHCVLSAILNIAKEHRESVQRYMPEIQKYATDRDPDIRRKVQLIQDVSKMKIPEPSAALLTRDPQTGRSE